MRAPDHDHAHASGDEHGAYVYDAHSRGGLHAAGHDEHGHADHLGEHGHERSDHEHGHEGFLGRLKSAVPFLHHHGGPGYDPTLDSSDRGIWAVKSSLVGMALTALIQVAVFAASGSVGLLADTIHNAADALTALPLWLAFALGRRDANRRYTYGYGRAEDVAGVVIVGVIPASALIAPTDAGR